MTNLRTITGLLLLLSFSVHGAALKLAELKAGQITYSNITVIGANVTDLYFTHAQGIGNVKLKYVSADLQKQFNFNPKAAAEAERKQLEADALYQSAVVSNMAYVAKAQASKVGVTNVVVSLADPISDKSLLGKPAPALEVEKWLGDKPETEGKFVLVGFWAPWSEASTGSIPELNALQKRFVKKLVVIGITPTEPEGDKPKLDFVCATDSKAKVTTAAGIINIPSVLLVDPKGIVVYQGHPAALTEKKLEAIFAQHAE